MANTPLPQITTLSDLAVASAPGSAGVRVGRLRQGTEGHPGGRPPPEWANVVYAPAGDRDPDTVHDKGSIRDVSSADDPRGGHRWHYAYDE